MDIATDTRHEVMSMAYRWNSTDDDDRLVASQKRVIDGTVQMSKDMKLGNRYIYQNYAGLGQDVFASYGDENKQKPIEISRKYDPHQVFQKLQPGYFKLNGQNGGSPT
jgi:hypothetical protein